MRQVLGKAGPETSGMQEGAPIRRADLRPVEAWRAWSACGDGGHVHLIIDPPARELWILPADDLITTLRSMR